MTKPTNSCPRKSQAGGPVPPQFSTPGRTPPHSVEAEESLIACCLIDGLGSLSACDDAGITAESFYEPVNRTIYEALCDMRNAGQPLEEVVLAEELRRREMLDAVGGLVRLNQITNRAPTTAHREYFLETVRNMQGLREIIDAATSAIEGCYGSQGDVAELAATVEQRMLAATSGVESKLPPVRDMADLFKNPPAKPDEIVAGMLPRRGLMNLGGGSKMRKSWVIAYLAICVATGKPWLGMPTKKSKVLILNFEIDDGYYVDRCKAIATWLGVDMPHNSIGCWNLCGYAADIDKLQPAIMAKMQAGRYDLVVLDPMYMLVGDRDESKASDMTDLMNRFKRIAVKGNAAVAFTTHFAKGNAASKNSIDRASGSGVLSRYPDVIATLTEHEEEECVTFECTVRNFRPVEKFALRWNYPVFVRDDDLDPDALKQPGGKRAEESSERHNGRRMLHDPKEIVGYFPAKVSAAEGLREIERAASEGTGISKQQFAAMRMELVNRGWITQDQQHRWFRTSTAEEFVQT